MILFIESEYPCRVHCQNTTNLPRVPLNHGQIKTRVHLLYFLNDSTQLNLIDRCNLLLSLDQTNDLRGVSESPEVVRHCLVLFFTHINSQQYSLASAMLIQMRIYKRYIFSRGSEGGKSPILSIKRTLRCFS